MTRSRGSALSGSPPAGSRRSTAAGTAARSTAGSRCSRWGGRLDPDRRPWIARAARVTRLTWRKDTRTGLWARGEEVALYACQIRLDAATFGRAVRAHWGIENRDHHVRDRTLREDDSRIRRRPGIFARLRSFALNILRADGVTNVSEAIYTNALSLDRLLAHGLPKSQN